jgi:hypothetical protein
MSGDDDWKKEAQKLEALAFSVGPSLDMVSKKNLQRAQRIAKFLIAQIEFAVPTSINGHGSVPDTPSDGGGDDSEGDRSGELDAMPPSLADDDGAHTRVIEYLILGRIETSDDRVNKRDLFHCLRELGLVADNMNAFTTRLSRMKANKILSWAEHVRYPAITITTGGHEHRAMLAARGANGLTTAELKWIEQKAPWARQ